jgi:hypothetical protein
LKLLVDAFAKLGFDEEKDVIESDIFSSIYNPGKLALLAAWSRPPSWRPEKTPAMKSLRHRQIRVVRDYGMFDRREAPQFYPDAQGRETTHIPMSAKESKE